MAPHAPRILVLLALAACGPKASEGGPSLLQAHRLRDDVGHAGLFHADGGLEALVARQIDTHLVEAGPEERAREGGLANCVTRVLGG